MTGNRLLVVIQARLASTRLPAKALLPIAGLPTVVLCARRAANTGLPVIVATSTEPADDEIARLVGASGVALFRGSHEDVLERFFHATEALADDAVVVRLTADNLFPDGSFIEDLLAEFERQGVDYLGTASPQDALPYGLSAEVFSVRALREAHRHASSPQDREHVTPWLRRHGRAERYEAPLRGANWSRLRCTLDTFDDYATLLRVFADQDPVAAPWRLLVARLSELTAGGLQARCPFRVGSDGRPRSILTLGTAQWGMRYGIANQSGVPSDAELTTLLAEAADAGIDSLDTARAYGLAEQRIGRLTPFSRRGRMEITTKLGVLDDLPVDASPASVRHAVEASVFQSAHALNVRSIDALLLHRWTHRRDWDGAVWDSLRALQDQGVIGRLGASVSSPAQAIEALAEPGIEQIQCPVNLVDARWRSDAFLAAVRSRPEVLVHARSVFLQGLLLLPGARWPNAGDADAIGLCELLDALVHELGRDDRADLCFAYVRSLPWVTSLVVGMESLAQLRLDLHLAQRPALSESERHMVDMRMPALPEALLDPSRWNQPHA